LIFARVANVEACLANHCNDRRLIDFQFSCGRVVGVKVETDGDLHIALQDATGSTPASPLYDAANYQMKYWKILADNLSQAGMELGLRLSLGFSRASDLDCCRASWRRKAVHCACR
jgi:hypothetical protein